MNLAQRRCHSEQPATQRARQVQIVAPHKAAKIREAQLRQNENGLCLLSAVDPGSTDHNANSHEKRLTPQANRNLSAPTTVSCPLANPNQLQESKSSSSNLPAEQPQLDGAVHFPNIGAVLGGSNDRDRKRAMAETEFYEQADKNGVVRRTSILRPVKKEDLLVARGANPRTGLVTPEANSVADSLDFGKQSGKEQQSTSAQWRLEGDQWVSIMAQEEAGGNPGRRTLQGENQQKSWLRHLNSEHVRSPTIRDASPLTRTNLQTFASQANPLDAEPQSQTPPQTPLTIRKIRRKPVGGLLKLDGKRHVGQLSDRQSSNETVVRIPRSRATGIKHAYFSPEDVGKAPAVHTQTCPGDKTHGQSSFLGPTVKPRHMTDGLPRGFTRKNMNLGQLQQSLRTNSGPYPFPASRQDQVSSETTDHLTSRDFLPRKHCMALGAPREERRAYRQPVPKVCSPNDTILYNQQRDRPSLEDFQAQTRSRRIHPREKAVPIVAENSLHLASARQIITEQPRSTIYMNTNISTPMSSTQMDKSLLASHEEDMISKQTTQPRAIDGSLESSARCHITIITSSPTSESNTSRPRHDEKLDAVRRPLMGPRLQETRRMATVADAETIMVSTDQSNKIGMNRVQPNVENDGDVSTGGPERDENIPPHAGGTGIPTEPGDKLVIYDARKSAILVPKSRDETDQRDHSICCPECCIQFDCHEGCLGHPGPAPSVADSETSSLVSKGVFDASFETSVKAVNQVFLEPANSSKSKLTRIRTAFSGGPCSKPTSPTQRSTKQELMKRTMRKAPTPQKISRELIRSASRPETNVAVTAAVRAINSGDSLQEKALRPKIPDTKMHATETAKATVSRQSARQAVTRANEARRVSGTAEVCLLQNTSCSKEIPIEPHSAKTLRGEGSDRMSVITRMVSLIRRPALTCSYMECHPVFANSAQIVMVRLKDMVIVIVDTASVISAMLFEYNRTGAFAVPSGSSASEVFGNCLRSILYLMITTCIYALVVKILRTALVILRLVLLPVRICAWVLG